MRKFVTVATLAIALYLSPADWAFARGRYTGTGAKSSSSRVCGYTKKNGTHVAPHRRSTGDSTQKNNWSTKGNTNPSTGKPGTKYATR